MALQQQKVPVQFRGLETKLDPRQAVIGDVTILENVRFDAPPKWQKRFGYARLDKAPAAVQIAAFRDELLINSGTELYRLGSNGLDAHGPRLANARSLVSASVSSFSILKWTLDVSPIDSAVAPNGVGIYLMTGGTSGLLGCKIIDTATGKVTYETLGAASGTGRRCLAIGNTLVAVWVDGANLNLISCDSTSNPGTPTTTLGISGGVVGANAVDGVVLNGVGYVFYRNATGIAYRTISSSLVVSAETVLVSGASPSAMAAFASSTTHFWLTYYHSGSVYAARYTAAGAQTLAPTVVATAAGVGLVAGIDPTGTQAHLFFEVADATYAWRTRVKTNTCNASGGALGTLNDFRRSAGLAGRPVLLNGLVHVLLVHPSSLQGACFLLSYDPAGPDWPRVPITAKSAAGYSGRLGSAVPSMLVSGSKLRVLVGKTDRVGALGGVVVTQFGVEDSIFDFSAPQFSQEMADTTLFSGGFMRSYDGQNLYEHGFHLYPEHVTCVPNAGVAGIPAGPVLSAPTVGTSGRIQPGTYYFRIAALFSDGTESFVGNELSGVIPAGPAFGSFTLVWTAVTSASGYRIYIGTVAAGQSDVYTDVGNVLTTGIYNVVSASPVPADRPVDPGYIPPSTTYQVCAVYEWVSAQGVVYQSAPSPPVTVVAAPSNSGFDYTVPMLFFTDRVNDGPTVVFYRTAGNQSVFFRVTPLPNYYGSGISYDSATGLLSFSEAPGALTTQEDYLKGNQQLVFNPLNSLAEVPPLPPDSVKFVTRFRNRVVAIPSESAGQIIFSKVCLPGVPIEFNPQQFFLSVQGGAPTLNAAVEMDDKLILFSGDRIYFMAGDGPAANGTGSDYGNPYRIPSDVGCTNPRSVVLTPQGVLFQSVKGIYLLGRDLSVSYFGGPVEAYGRVPVTSANTLPDSNRVILTLNSGVALVYDSFVQKWSVWTNYNAADAFSFDGKFTHVRPDGSINQEDPTRFTDQEAASITPILIKFTTTWLSFAGLNGFQRVWRFSIRGDYKSPHSLKVDVAFDDDPTVVQSITFDTAAYFGVATFKPYEFLVKLSKQKCSSLQVTITETEPSGQEGEGFALSGLTFLAGLLPGLHKVPAGRTIS